MRVLIGVLSVALLAGCEPPPNITQKGVGFESYASYQRRREAELMAQEQARRAPRVAAAAPVAPPTAPHGQTATAAPATQPEVIGAPLSALSAQPVSAQAARRSNPGISDEQNFSAVASRESIASDRARIEENRQQYQEVAPTALPQRRGGSGPSIVEYALAATNSVGQSIYKRSGIALANSRRACAGFASPDLAQAEFLRRGGPNRDPKNLDPDGDGFACT